MTRRIQLFVCLMTMLSTGAALAQEAYVYDNLAAGTYVYDASSTGKLTLIKGSPFQTVGSLIGTNGKFFVTANATTVFSYVVASNGGIGKVVSEINTQKYTGSECGTMNSGGEFDRTGAHIYIPLSGDENGNCDSLQTYGISNTGILTFKGATEYNQGGPFNISVNSMGLPTITGNGKFAYGFLTAAGFDSVSCYGPSITTFAAESGGVLNYQAGYSGSFPALPPGVSWVLLGSMTDDPTDHVAIAVDSINSDCGVIRDITYTGPAQLMSATVDSQGNLTSTNTYENMPTLAGDGSPSSMVLDPTGKILAVATGTGVQFFHFNGASPITTFTGVIGVSGYITHMSWDSDGHLYAQNGASGKMHVYEVSTKSAKELSGSPTLIPIGTVYGNPVSSFVVRSK